MWSLTQGLLDSLILLTLFTVFSGSKKVYFFLPFIALPTCFYFGLENFISQSLLWTFYLARFYWTCGVKERLPYVEELLKKIYGFQMDVEFELGWCF